jgi:hypothetical protein
MSRAKFASVTAGLLARKGEARPWTPVDAQTKSYDWRSEIHDAAQQPAVERPRTEMHVEARVDTRPETHHHLYGHAHVHDGDKRYAIRMSPKEYERLGIIAVKRSVTRQYLMREMIEQFLQSAASEYCAGCTCLDPNNCEG